MATKKKTKKKVAKKKTTKKSVAKPETPAFDPGPDQDDASDYSDTTFKDEPDEDDYPPC
jgi:hypothetical protein